MRHDRLLRTTLTVNAAVSGVAGVATAALSGVLADPLGIPQPVLLAVGLALLPFVALLWRFGNAEDLGPRHARVAITGDIAWVLASVVVLAASPSGLTTLGHWVIGIVALGVADFAVLEWVGVRRLDRDAAVSSTPRGRQPVAP